ncbi:GIY-YIG nuclease family protein [Labrys sp. KNU-23]|uniref:GIY-YIG nuclease family protein n=1 Tax=Labrys sp. KNU-23 TaxID=2789216 RepID=UPI0011EC55FF|nr:GIY-YIG nuclease family protein [Labrys sp. KNU-23]QEN84758.1 GIY-YIG nuclease family protein [Labrys sp. KNU-23]
MPIALRDIWKIERPDAFKIHLARWNDHSEPLEVFVRSRDEWQRWQEYWPRRNDFNRQYIFALARFYHETDIWLFGGVYEVLSLRDDQYEVKLTDMGAEFIGRLKLRSPFRGRTTRANFENHYDLLEVQEILREPYTGRQFPGYDNIDLPFEELEALVKNDRPDWKAALENMKGVYLISDTLTGKRYVGSAYGDQGIWSRWCNYALSGHGGNVELKALVTDPTLNYCRTNFHFALLEHRSARTPDETIIARETFWKRILFSRGAEGLNRN